MALNNGLDIYTSEQDSCPRSTAGTGTIQSVNNNQKIVGTGTLFLTEFKIGDFVYILAKNEFREVVNIVSNTELTIDRPFTTVVAAATAYRITPKVNFTMISWRADSSGSVDINGVTFPADYGSTQNKDGLPKGTGNNFCFPIDIDSTANANSVYVSVSY